MSSVSSPPAAILGAEPRPPSLDRPRSLPGAVPVGLRVTTLRGKQLKRGGRRADPVSVVDAVPGFETTDAAGRLARLVRRAVADRIRAGRYRPPLCAVAEAVLPWILIEPLPLAGSAPARHTARR